MDALPADVLGYLLRRHVSPPGARRSYRDVGRCAAVCRAWRSAIGGSSAAGACRVRRRIADDAALNRLLAPRPHVVELGWDAAPNGDVSLRHYNVPGNGDDTRELRWDAVARGDAGFARRILVAVRDAACIFGVHLQSSMMRIGRRRQLCLRNGHGDDARLVWVAASATFSPDGRARHVDVRIVCVVAYRSHPAPYAMARAALRHLLRRPASDDGEWCDFFAPKQHE